MNGNRTKNSKKVNKGMKNGFNPLSQNEPEEKSQNQERNEIKISSNENSKINSEQAKEIELKDKEKNHPGNDKKVDTTEAKNEIKEKIISYKYEPVSKNDLFEEIKIKLEKRNYNNNNELIIDLNNLINESAIINKFNEFTLLTPNFFEIFEEINVKRFLLTINLLNYLNIINGIWSYTKGKVDEFVSILKELEIFFSYVKRDNKKNDKEIEIDVVLLTPKSPVIYNYISTYGELGFVNTDFMIIAKEYCAWNQKYNYDSGFCFEDFATLYLCDTLDKDNFITFPNVTYFIKNEYAESLIKLNLIEIPKSYKVCSSKNEDFKGYNEMDLIIQMKNDVKIEENYNFNQIIDGDLKKEGNAIILEKEMTYVFEIKKRVEDFFQKIEHVDKVQDRYIEAFKNVKYNKNPIFNIKEYKKILLCDQNYAWAKKKINEKKLNNKNIIYSNPQVGITSLLRLNKNFKYLNKEMIGINNKYDNLNSKYDQLEKEMQELKKLYNDENIDNKLIQKEKEMEKKEKEKLISENKFIEQLSKDNLYEMSLKSLNDVLKLTSYNVTNIIKNVKNLNLIGKLLNNSFYCFEMVFKELKKKENLFFKKVEPLIDGQINFSDDKEINEIKNLLKQKIDKAEIYSIYYEGIKNFLFGLEEKNPIFYFYVFNSEARKNIKYLIGFTEILEKNKNITDIECKYQGAIMFLADLMFEGDKLNNIMNFANKESQDNKEIIKILITCINIKNYEGYIKKYENLANSE